MGKRDQLTQGFELLLPFVQRLADERTRKDVLSAAEHAKTLKQEALPESGLAATISRFASDEKLVSELKDLVADLRSAGEHVADRGSKSRAGRKLLALGAGVALIAYVLTHRGEKPGYASWSTTQDDAAASANGHVSLAEPPATTKSA